MVSCEFLLPNLGWPMNDSENSSGKGDIKVFFSVPASLKKIMASQDTTLRTMVIQIF